LAWGSEDTEFAVSRTAQVRRNRHISRTHYSRRICNRDRSRAVNRSPSTASSSCRAATRGGDAFLLPSIRRFFILPYTPARTRGVSTQLVNGAGSLWRRREAGCLAACADLRAAVQSLARRSAERPACISRSAAWTTWWNRTRSARRKCQQDSTQRGRRPRTPGALPEVTAGSRWPGRSNLLTAVARMGSKWV
jgi:hypothetical protein